MQASRSQLLPSPNRTCVSGQLFTGITQLWKGKKYMDPSPFSTDLTAVWGGGGGGWMEGTQLYPDSKPRGEGHHVVMVTSELAKELRTKRPEGAVWGQQLSVGPLLQVKMPRLE